MCLFLSSFIQLEGRKISSSQFLKVLSTLRVWEICAPDINAAIEVGNVFHSVRMHYILGFKSLVVSHHLYFIITLSCISFYCGKK